MPDSGGEGPHRRSAWAGWLPEGDEVAGTAEMFQTMRELGVASVHSALARALDANLQRELGDYLATAIGAASVGLSED
ncbi:hypothetical protein QIE55_31970 [Rhodococcus erythropolis]|uniref:Uncharacterized protein n=1 Tax=Rhodococcus erythropolis TaxID=1833 RepID=A0AAX3ZYT6_RHOER|nr:hypothetical protein [Rhodococcus erythropolis]WMN01915.1 hypothetical protein QIE55_31970 [Rhodococcus erythropolis]